MRKVQGKWCSLVAATLVFLSGCSSSPIQDQVPDQDQIQAERYRLKQDVGPSGRIDVSKIPDAVPRLHEGSFKTAPYKVAGVTYTPMTSAAGYVSEGIASWYGSKFHGYRTANGEIYDMYGMTAAHKTLPLPSYARVTSLSNGRSIIVRVNDRGPFMEQRVIDLSYAAAKKLGYQNKGLGRVRVEGIDASDPEAIAAATMDKELASVTSVTYENPAAVNAETKIFSGTGVVPAEQKGSMYLQIAALEEKERAVKLQQQLTDLMDYAVSVLGSGDDNLFRIRIGPLGSPADLDIIRGQLREARLGSGIVIYVK